MAYRITGKRLEGNYLGAPTTSCKPKDYPTKERISIDLNGKTYERTIHERIIWRASGKHTLKARFVIIDGSFWEVEEASETITIDGIEWEPKTFEELVGMGFIPDEGTSGLIRYDSEGTLWSAMVVDGCCSCTIQSDSWGWLDDAFGATLEEAIRAMVEKHGATYREEA